MVKVAAVAIIAYYAPTYSTIVENNTDRILPNICCIRFTIPPEKPTPTGKVNSAANSQIIGYKDILKKPYIVIKVTANPNVDFLKKKIINISLITVIEYPMIKVNLNFLVF